MGQARTLFKGIVCLLFIMFMRERTVAQNGVSDVHGTVLTVKGESLPSVAVQAIEKGSGQKFNTLTDPNGDFIFRNFEVGKQYDFHFSIMGYEKNDYLNFTVENKGKNLLLVRLTEKSIGLNDVVVVGYGTQKKVNLTGAVNQVDAKTFADKPVSNVAQALQGAIPNLNITFGDGHPGSTGNFNIRGYASITNSGGSPLILIDGVPGNIDMLNPQDIETLTVLKDAASAAIYGARGAFGVILVTTKQAKKGALSINYGTSLSTQKNTTRTDFITDGYTQVNLADIAFSRNVGNSYTGYNADDYAELKKRQTDKSLPSVVLQNRNGQNQYVYYGSTDWWNFLFRKSQPGTEHHFSMSGGSDKVDFLLSGRYYQQKGMFQSYLKQDIYNAYNFRAKINVHLAPWLTVYSNTQFGANDYTWPGYNQNMTGLYNHAMASYLPKNPDGTFTFRTNLNNYGAYEYADLQNGKSHGGNKNYNITNTVGFNATILKGLSLTGNYAYQLDPYSDYQRTAFIPWSVNPGIINKAGNDQLSENVHLDQHHSVNLFATYEKSLRKHNLKVVGGYNMELQKYKLNSVARQNLLSEDLNQIDLGTGATTVAGNAAEWALLGYFARINYDYEGKYLLELNGRYDGSSRFPANQRYGFFPSVSAGWRISEEAFFSGLKNVMNEFKLRASYGSLGNQDVGNDNLYPYVPVMNSTLSKWIVNGNQTQTLSVPDPITPNFTWERSASTNAGIDVGFMKNRLQVSYDWYSRKTTNMLIPGKTLSSVFGAASPLQNAGDLQTKGFEVSVKWQDHGKLAGKPFSYNVGVVLSDYTAKITKFDNPENLLSNHYVGQQLGEIWGYSIDGFFKSESEAQNWAINQDYVDRDQRLTSPGEWSKLHAGDLKFKDLNGDKIVNEGKNTLADHGDLRRIGNSLPRYSFGFNAAFNWNNFDLSLFFQGIGKQNWYPNVESSKFWGPYGRPYASFVPKDFESQIWSENNPNAYYPLLRGYAAYPGGELSVNNDKYLQNLAYIRLKNLTVGYNLPTSLVRRWKMQKLRLYFTGQNLLTFTKMKTKYIDPEQVSPGANDAGGRDYPFFKQYSGGFDITF
ncbi:TonB-linked outer membrane protein, SusC/RagA family [Chitinophaga sp. CF118]|uniref:SusC/RagA family TonB-linked outer membrane protein n=1 Tax=Chitinophaga sp. CF118 TaxID=1884367 RepID=UPI0008E8CFE2|nr:TonB-dependent receptor [Chitinophaga sp. CF118]SFD47794.1 TonB-linked outer membrane protein, SusC/RagA family [Chitinophaga sp. CF118]